MIEFLILSAAWIVFVVFISRKDAKRLLRPSVGVVLPVAGGLAAATLEALPACAISPGFTLRTVIAVIAGVFAGRLFGKLVKLWAMGQERRNGSNFAAQARLVHPLIAAGLAVAGIPTLWQVTTANYGFIEAQTTPRDEKTGIVHGCEEVRLDGGTDAVLLLHGLYGSPTDFGDLPQRLHAKGFAVLAPLFPGHGRRPDDLDLVWSADYRKAARSAFDELAATHPHVAVVGYSMGGTLALFVAVERRPSAIVLASPYLGHLATPPWCPVAFDSLVGPLSHIVQRVVVNVDLRGRGYSTQSLHALRQCRDLGAGVDTAAKDVSCRVLVLVGDADRVVPSPFAADWTTSHLASAKLVHLPKSDHGVYFDVDAGAAADETVRFLAE